MKVSFLIWRIFKIESISSVKNSILERIYRTINWKRLLRRLDSNRLKVITTVMINMLTIEWLVLIKMIYYLINLIRSSTTVNMNLTQCWLKIKWHKEWEIWYDQLIFELCLLWFKIGGGWWTIYPVLI